MGIPLRVRGGRLMIELRSKTRSDKSTRLKLKVDHRKAFQRGKETTEVYSPLGRCARPLLNTSHSGFGKRKVRGSQKFWRVINLTKLREPRPCGEQRMTIKDATLPGGVAGRTVRIARLNVEKFYGRSLPEEDFALIKVEDWRAVRHLKKWPPAEEEDDSLEDLSVCFGFLAIVS